VKRFDIVRRRRIWFSLSLLISLAGIIAMFVMGLNLGTDFKAGTRVQVELGSGFDTQAVRNAFASIHLQPDRVTVAGATGDTAMVRLAEKITPQQEAEINKVIKEKFPQAKGLQVTSVDPIVAKELSQKAVYAVLAAAVGIILYMSIRFEYRFAISGVISLLQVVLFVVSVFALLQVEIDLTFIAALLTIVGYSIHDTIVIFDRIRENLKHRKIKTVKDLEDLVNDSLWQTMRRSINTVVTVVISAGLLYILGGPSIRNFSFALLIGLVFGAWSSIFIASQIWVSWRKRGLKA
jgi:preprotein translocase subunit SecF